MLRLGILTARGRLAAFIGAFVALMGASVLTMAWGMQLEAVLRGDAPVERYAGAVAVVTGQQDVGADHDVLLTERARVELRPRGASGGRARRQGRYRRRIGAGAARGPGRRRPRVGQRGARLRMC